ncbi:hypothetical protein M595_4309 [Lyngbya aestuarii BL J]|uniref:Uncharacterized protein n=1 Tax=Lyngbya aestuarii BL J TaxID=1348334 RepID=U7QCZ4_9CYAN|nr:hypothetical protein M595_4309 [Lyngbya aestuarii BL J]
MIKSGESGNPLHSTFSLLLIFPIFPHQYKAEVKSQKCFRLSRSPLRIEKD